MIPDHEMKRLMEAAEASGESVDGLTKLRLDGHPLQYLERTIDFGPLTLDVDPRVLIPRPETEHLADLLVRRDFKPELVVDMCTGSGALALFFKHAWPEAQVVAAELSAEALIVARKNGRNLNLEIQWCEGDLFEALPSSVKGTVDLLVANPPYVAESDWHALPADVRKEPRVALVAGPMGTEVIDRIFEGVCDWLAPGGEAWVEIGQTQGEYLIERHSVSILRDQYDKDRYAMVRRD